MMSLLFQPACQVAACSPLLRPAVLFKSTGDPLRGNKGPPRSDTAARKQIEHLFWYPSQPVPASHDSPVALSSRPRQQQELELNSPATSRAPAHTIYQPIAMICKWKTSQSARKPPNLQRCISSLKISLVPPGLLCSDTILQSSPDVQHRWLTSPFY